jgi:enoyl-CoA hydratase/carnithine racemase
LEYSLFSLLLRYQFNFSTGGESGANDLPFPIVTAVNGAAAGVGMSFALMGDLILCARSADFLQAFRRIGLVPDGGSTWLLPRLIGRARGHGAITVG